MNKLIPLLNSMRKLDRTFTVYPVLSIKEIKVKKPTIPRQNKITLISPDNSISLTNLKDAQNLSNRKELKLVKIQDVDAKTVRPVYKLMTSTEYHEEELRKRKERQEAKKDAAKGEKVLTFSPKIGEHDLMTRVKQILKLLEKQYEVRVVIAGAEHEMQTCESVYEIIEGKLKTAGKFVQKRTKGNSVRFQILPNKETKPSPESPEVQKPSNEKLHPKTDTGPL